MVEDTFNPKYLGMRAKDTMTGFKGIIESGDEWLNGCVRYALRQEKIDKEGKEYPLLWVDAFQVEIVDEKTRFTKQVKKTGGPRQSDTFR